MCLKSLGLCDFMAFRVWGFPSLGTVVKLPVPVKKQFNVEGAVCKNQSNETDKV